VRGDFNPALAGERLRNLVLVEGPTPSRPGVYIRLAGDAFNANVRHDMAGENWLDFLPAQFRADALATAELICSHPCGIWQLTPSHYERGYSQLIEATIFPLGETVQGTPLMLGHLEFLDWPEWHSFSEVRVLSVETALDFAFIDIGAGLPDWTIERNRLVPRWSAEP